MKVEGACHCGLVTYEAEIDPTQVVVCHCTDCQVISGGAYTVNVRAAQGTFRLLGGDVRIYVKTTADSGTPRAHGFCPVCATRIYSGSVDGTQYSLRVGALKQRKALKPKAQVWCQSAFDWAIVPATHVVAKQ